jgi:hypothetical protein
MYVHMRTTHYSVCACIAILIFQPVQVFCLVHFSLCPKFTLVAVEVAFLLAYYSMSTELTRCCMHIILCFPQLPAAYPTVTANPKPKFPGPHNFFAYVLFVTIICGFLNILSLGFSVPALMFVTMVSTLEIKVHCRWGHVLWSRPAIDAWPTIAESRLQVFFFFLSMAFM